jgi:L-ascorbate metabolism protein UlaG (beta-lactamase superfamily)
MRRDRSSFDIRKDLFMEYRLLRHTTAVLSYGGKRLLIDAMLDEQGARPAIGNTANDLRNPLIPLSKGWQEWVRDADAYLITHLHSDHVDDTGRLMMDRDKPLFCQPEDLERLTADGFTNLLPIESRLAWEGITLVRTGAQHGTGQVGRMLAPVSGFVLTAEGEPVLYIAGDTIWCDDVETAISEYQPEVIIASAGGASFLTGGPIIMDAGDLSMVRAAAPEATIIVNHLDAINHCHETRDLLRARLAERGVNDLLIPEDGELVVA